MQPVTQDANLWQARDRQLVIGRRPLILGIVNITPDSFSDGGSFSSPDNAVAHGLKLVEEGADLLDIGGESSRPGAAPVPLEEELRRVLPVVEGLASRTNVPLSVDTVKAEVARQCLERGVCVINDITSLTGDPQMLEVARTFRAGVILMHMQGTPPSMQVNPHYENVVLEVYRFLAERIREATANGIARERIAVDPGIGFGKSRQHNLEILACLEQFQRLGRPVCLGVSRKGFMGSLLNRPVQERQAGSLAAVCDAVVRKAAQIVRVHDVAGTRDALIVLEAIQEPREKPQTFEEEGR
jgi:dihydropteroate synthase